MEIIKIKEHFYNQHIEYFLPNRMVTFSHITNHIRWCLSTKIESGIDEQIYMDVFREIKNHLSNNLNYESRWNP